VILTSGRPEIRFGDRGGSTGSGLGVARGGAGTTPVMPSGPSPLLVRDSSRNRSAAPPGLGLKAAAADAAFHKAPARSPLDFFALIMGPKPGRLSSGSGGGPSGASAGVGLDTALTNGVPLDVISGVIGGFSASLREPTSELVSDFWAEVSIRGDVLSLLRGGGCGSLLKLGLIKGAGTKSLSEAAPSGLVGSMGGRFRSGRSTCAGT
jgi:hypothetical protein